MPGLVTYLNNLARLNRRRKRHYSTEHDECGHGEYSRRGLKRHCRDNRHW